MDETTIMVPIMVPIMIVGGIVVVIAGFCVAFLPIIIAWNRRHRNRWAIAVATIVGLWPIALIWAFTDNVEPDDVYDDEYFDDNPYSIDHREYDVPLRDVTHTDTPPVAETQRITQQRDNTTFWPAGIAATFVIVAIAAVFVLRAFMGDGAAPAKLSVPFTLGPGERIEPVPEARFYPVNKHVPLPRPRPMN
jgi:hypothetical protein